jgi:hypothetical protein
MKITSFYKIHYLTSFHGPNLSCTSITLNLHDHMSIISLSVIVGN